MVGERLGEEKDFIQRDVYTKYCGYTEVIRNPINIISEL